MLMLQVIEKQVMSCPIHGNAGNGGKVPAWLPHGNKTATAYISEFKQGAINREFPAEYLNETLFKISADAHKGAKRARTAMKLLISVEYNKTQK